MTQKPAYWVPVYEADSDTRELLGVFLSREDAIAGAQRKLHWTRDLYPVDVTLEIFEADGTPIENGGERLRIRGASPGA